MNTRIKKFRKKIFITFIFLFLFRVLNYIPVPFINKEALKLMSNNDIINYLGLFSGGALSNFTLMAVSVNSFITASIVIQLMTYSIEPLYRLSKYPGGQKKIKQIQMVLGIILGFFTSLIMVYAFNKQYSLLSINKPYVYIIIATIHTIGTMIAIWIGEYIEDNGIGNGMSMLIFANIVSRVPSIVSSYIKVYKGGNITNLYIALFVIIFVFYAIILAETSEYRIPLRYAKVMARMQGKSNVSGKSYLPIKINMAGVMPIIFTVSFLQIISFLTVYLGRYEMIKKISKFIEFGSIGYSIIMIIMIFIFTIYYMDLIFDPVEVSTDMQSNTAIIPNVLPGKDTVNYLKYIIKRISFLSGFYLCFVAILPTIAFSKLGVASIGATSLMILVNVSIDFVKKYINERRLLKYKTI